KTGDYDFNLDCPHAYKYGVDTECEQAVGCCGDGTCNAGEDCGNCPADCDCPPQCPSVLEIGDCKTCAGINCNVTYTVGVQNSTGYMNLSINPTIYITNNTDTDSHVMDKAVGQTGIYNYTVGILKKTDKINATVYVSHLGCPTISNLTDRVKINSPSLPNC
ncbi:MAG: hypothetical protein KAU03_05985, partial [Candidatus Altiarchaeales archaeon]|nr:hypothetical protein [Candidatus Altiarchaeales archaeon]